MTQTVVSPLLKSARDRCSLRQGLHVPELKPSDTNTPFREIVAAVRSCVSRNACVPERLVKLCVPERPERPLPPLSRNVLECERES